MSSKELSTQEPVPARGTARSVTDLKGWEQVGYYGFYLIYGKENKRWLVDSKTGQSTFEYTVVLSNSGRSVINGKELVSAGDKNRGQNARLRITAHLPILQRYDAEYK